jgi:hypothetical protein
MDVTVQDTGSGLQGIGRIRIVNGTVRTAPSRVPFGGQSVVVTAVKSVQGAPTSWGFDMVDVAGNTARCE